MYDGEVRLMVIGLDVSPGLGCETWPVTRAEITDRWHAGVAALRRDTSPPPRLSRRAWAVDTILAFALAVAALDGALNRTSITEVGTTPSLPATPAGVPVPPTAPAGLVTQHYGAVHPWQIVLAVLATLPLVGRRKYPVAVLCTVIGGSVLYHLSPGFDPTFTFAACVIAAFSAVMYSRYQFLAVVGALAGVGLLVAVHKENVPSIGTARASMLLLVLLPVALVANTIYTWSRRVRSAEADQQAASRLAVEEERSRIARELHDVITHNVSVMMVQAGAARKVMATAPDRAQQALLAVESGGRAAMTELRHFIGLLTTNGDEPDQPATADLAPAPGLGQVAALAARIRDTGVPVHLTVTGTPMPLPAGVDLAAYRVVQEALTNTVKHAAGAQVKITIGYDPGALRVEVADTGGTSAASAGSGSGRGLIGLRERLAVYGGALDAGGSATGGYRVSATIPLDES
jgi:signal transduction histidine kinase